MADEFEGVDLLTLAGLDTTDIAAKRMGEVLPRMFADFICVGSELKALEKDGKNIGGVAQFTFAVEGIITMLDKGADVAPEADLIGKKQDFAQIIKNADGIGYCLGFLEDIGVKQRGPLGDLIKAAEGKRIRAVLTHRKDKDDADKKYVGLAKIKIRD